jgi:hypothetical protein
VDIEEIIQRVQQQIHRDEYDFEFLDKARKDLNLSVTKFCDKISRSIVDGYVSEKYEWLLCDHVMNRLDGYAGPANLNKLSKYSWEVYLAFDYGEYLKEGQSSEHNPNEDTKPLIMKIIKKYHKDISPKPKFMVWLTKYWTMNK